MPSVKRIALLLVLGFAAAAQPISFGVRGGVPLTDAYTTLTETSGSQFVKTFSGSKEYVAGLMLEVRLPFSLSVEADALYHPLKITTQAGTGATVVSTSTATTHSLEFPIVAKYRFLHLPVVKPYVEAGPSFRALGLGGSYQSGKGITLGGGVELKLLKLRLEPELRYTHWGADSASALAAGNLPSAVNQAQFLVGLAF